MIQEKIYQTIIIKDSLESYITDSIEFPFTQLNTLYIKLIVYKKINGIMTPVSILTVQPNDVLSRIYIWTQDQEDALIEASDIATKQYQDYQKLIEEEIKNQSNPNLIEKSDQMWC